ncbi:hypothetical protein ACSBR1_013775 [Camellia fascicularis]
MKSALNRCRDIWIRRYPSEQFFVVHKRYVKRLRRKLRFEEKTNSNQRRVLSDSETVWWLNHAVEKIWPVCMEQIVSQKILLPVMPWFLQQYKPWTAARIMYYWFKQFKDGPNSEMGGFTRILHSGKPDSFMDEIPTFVAEPLLAGTDQVLFIGFLPI